MTAPYREDIENIFHYVGLVLIALGLCMAVPLVVSLVAGEWASVLDLFITLCITVGWGTSSSSSFAPGAASPGTRGWSS
ncbi:hypothetical protein [Candidatus Solincola sp.]|nr:hypothetical protein [Actinomycetota bacterium]MDI7251180.1 hypothetical protein [Actinomycetota bacterium]